MEGQWKLLTLPLVTICILTLFAKSAKSDGLVNFYNCAEKQHDGNYVHPYDCSKFISCVGPNHAYEQDCPLNHDGGRLHYNPYSNSCDYPEIVGCVTTGDYFVDRPFPSGLAGGSRKRSKRGPPQFYTDNRVIYKYVS